MKKFLNLIFLCLSISAIFSMNARNVTLVNYSDKNIFILNYLDPRATAGIKADPKQSRVENIKNAYLVQGEVLPTQTTLNIIDDHPDHKVTIITDKLKKDIDAKNFHGITIRKDGTIII